MCIVLYQPNGYQITRLCEYVLHELQSIFSIKKLTFCRDSMQES